MKKTIKRYIGFEITDEVISKKNLIAMRRYAEGYYSFLFDGIDTLEDLAYCSNCEPEQMNIFLGEDWFIAYTDKDSVLEITEWIDVPREDDKITQTMEMFQTMIYILLQSEGKELYATMRHHTSYKFYEKFKNLGYLEEIFKWSQMEPDIPSELEKIVNTLQEKYHDLDEYFADEERIHFPEYGEYIYHDIRFAITDKFINRFKKDNLKSSKSLK